MLACPRDGHYPLLLIIPRLARPSVPVVLTSQSPPDQSVSWEATRAAETTRDQPANTRDPQAAPIRLNI